MSNDAFWNDKYRENGLCSQCKFCMKEKQKERQLENPERVKELKRKWFLKNIKTERKRNRIQMKKWRREHTKQAREASRQNYERHKAQRIIQATKYRKTHILEARKWVAKSSHKRFKNDQVFRMIGYLRHRVWRTIVRECKSATTSELIGCSPKDLKAHIEKQFKAGMTWNNHSMTGWHVDHIKPCAAFDLTKPKEQRKCFNFKNLQPLWAKENYRKGCKYPYKLA